MSCPTHNYDNGNRNIANTTCNDGRIGAITGKPSPFGKAIREHNSEQLYVTTPFITHQCNSDNWLESRPNENPLISQYRNPDKLTSEQKCNNCEEMKNILSKFQERLKQLEIEVDQICEFINRESKSEKHGYIYKLYKYVSQKFQLSNTAEDSTCSKLQEISKFIKDMQKNFNEQDIFLLQRDSEITELQKENKGLKDDMKWLQSSKNSKIKELNKQISDLNEKYSKEISDKNNLVVYWQQRFDTKVGQCRSLEKDKQELNEKYKKDITSMQDLLDETNMQLKNYSHSLDVTSSNLIQETSQRERLQEELNRLQKLVYVRLNALGTEKERFQHSISKKLKLLTDYKDAISLEDVELKAESQFVVQTIETINKLQDEAAEYEEQIDNFNGNRGDKSYLHIREMLVRVLERLDAIESQNNEEIKTKRKTSIIYVKKLQDRLDKKTTANSAYS